MIKNIDIDMLLEALYDADAISARGAKIIREFPAVEVAEVVRCRECRFRVLDGADVPVCTGAMAYCHTPDDWFCASGKYKDREANI